MVAQYLEYLTYVRRAKPRTIRNYSYSLHLFEKFRNGREVNKQLISFFQIELAKKNLKPSTVNGHLTALRTYYMWQKEHNLPCFDYREIKLSNSPLPKMEYLNADELNRFFRSINAANKKGIRNKAMIVLLYVSGLRVSELNSLNRDSIDFTAMEIQIEGKGGKTRTVYLTKDCCNLLLRYLEIRTDNEEALFISYRNPGKSRRLSTVSIEYIVREYGKKAGIKKKVTPHCLRRSFATNLHLNGCPITGIQEMLGHSTVLTTQAYIRFANPEIKTMHSKYLTPIT